ncbi:MAG TPA: LEA type 2 family protein [Burkholderiales bacterium]
MRTLVSRFLVALLTLLAGCQSLQDMAGMAQKPTAQIVGSSIRGLSLQNAVFLFDIEVANPYGAALPLADLSYTLGSNGRKILDGSVQPTGSIPARGKQLIQLPVTVGFAPVMAALKGVKPGAVLPYTADFKLGVDAPIAGRIEIPLSKSGELPIPAVPEVEMAGFEIGRLGLDQTSGTVKMRVRNTNQFPLELKRLGMSFALGGQEVGSSRLSDAASLQPGESATLSVPLSFSPRTVGASLFNLLRGNQIAYKVSGSIEANTRFGPISIPYSKIGNTAVVRP